MFSPDVGDSFLCGGRLPRLPNSTLCDGAIVHTSLITIIIKYNDQLVLLWLFSASSWQSKKSSNVKLCKRTQSNIDIRSWICYGFYSSYIRLSWLPWRRGRVKLLGTSRPKSPLWADLWNRESAWQHPPKAPCQDKFQPLPHSAREPAATGWSCSSRSKSVRLWSHGMRRWF